jgi:hypothetical protein
MPFDQLDGNTLRQGDIVADVPFPLLRLDKKPKFLGTFKRGKGEHVELDAAIEPIKKRPWLVSLVPTSISFCCVLSQCCDVASNQNPPPPSFVVCRLVPVTSGMRNAENYEGLRNNIDPFGAGHPYYQLFHIGHEPPLDEEYVADFGQAASISWLDYDAILKRKILQLDDLERSKFRIKAGAYFGRTPVEDKHLAYPWEPILPPPTKRLSERMAEAWRVLRSK